MRRLYQKIYLTIVASLLLVVLVAGTIWRFGSAGSPMSQMFEFAGELASAALPPADAPRAAQQDAVERLAARLKVDMTLFDASLAPIAQAGRALPPPRGGGSGGPRGPGWSLHLPDGRWIVARAPRLTHPALGFVVFLAAIALAVAAAAYPVVRGLTRRLERLQTGVETLGAGNLATRVKVEGRDEVARLAESFNRAAARIEDLVQAHRLLLANASHELRTPLARIRMGVELMRQSRDPRYEAELARDIAELDELIDEVLLASRLEAAPGLQSVEEVDLLALAAEEGARYADSAVAGEAVTLRGEARLLRRLIRNLLENAKRHGRPPIRVDVRRSGGRAVLRVSDAGPGVPQPERENVFAPFRQIGSGGGAGLGLALVRQIARLHGGEAAVAGDAPSAFEVTLPLVPAGAAAGRKNAVR